MFDNNRADVEKILEYFDVHELEYSNDDFEAIVKKLDDIRVDRKRRNFVNAIDEVERAINHLFEVGGYISYEDGLADYQKTYFEATDFLDNLSFDY